MQLLLEVYEKQLVGAVLNGSAIERLESIPVSVQTDLGYSEAMKDLLQRFGSLLNFESMSCSVALNNMTLVPAGMFQVSDAAKFLQFSSSNTVDAKEVDYSRLNYFSCVAVYPVPSWLKSTLIPKYPRVVIQHEQVHLLRKLEHLSTGVTQLSVVIHPNHALLALVKHGNLLWNLRITVDTADDILYHILNGADKMELSDLPIVVYAQTEAAQEIRKQLLDRKELIPKLKAFKWTATTDSHLQFQELCV